MRRVVGAVCTDVDGGTANIPNQINANIFSRRALLIRRSQARATFPAGEGFLLVKHRTDSRGRLSLQVLGWKTKKKRFSFVCPLPNAPYNEFRTFSVVGRGVLDAPPRYAALTLAFPSGEGGPRSGG